MDVYPCGHPRVPENTYTRKTGRHAGQTRCKHCAKAARMDLHRRKLAGLPMKPHHNTAKTHCKSGHEFTPANTRIVPSTGHRQCRACSREFLSGAGYLKKYQLKRRYHLTLEERSAILVEQDGLCAICYDVPATQVDHDHETGRVRGLLCGNCNKAIGLFNDSTDALAGALDYLQQKG